MKKGFGFIGCGNMGGALAKAVAASIGGADVLLNNRSEAKAAKLADEIGAAVSDKQTILNRSKFVMLGVKPQNLEELLVEIKKIRDDANCTECSDSGKEGEKMSQPTDSGKECEKMSQLTGAGDDKQIFVTMAAARTMDYIAAILGPDTPVIRIMPNMPVSIGEGIVITSINDNVSKDDYDEFADAMKESGLVDLVPESLIDTAMSVSGCGPAYIYMMIEAMRDAGIRMGMPENTAYEYAVRTMSGSVDLLIRTGRDVSKLRESICSPGGTTIEGVDALNENGFDEIIYKALKAAADKAKKM